MSAYTKGEWVFRVWGQEPVTIDGMAIPGTRMLTNDGGAPIVCDGRRIVVVDAQAKSKRGEAWKVECAERDANARLIAAAPDLLELLSDSVLDLEFFVALAGTNGYDQRAEDASQRLTRIRAAIAKATHP